MQSLCSIQGTIGFFHNKLPINSLNLMTRKLQPKGFDPRVSSVEGQRVNHYAMEPSVIASILNLTLVCVYWLSYNFLNSGNSLTVPIKMEYLDCHC